MTPVQKLFNALAALANAKKYDQIGDYLELASVTIGATADDKDQLDALSEEILERARTKTMPTAEERQSVRDRRHELADQIANLPPR